MAAGRHLGFDITRNSAIRSAYLKTLPRTKQLVHRSDHSLRRYGHSRIMGNMGLHGRRGSAMVPLSYSVFCNHSRPQFAIECLRSESDAQINRGWVTWAKISGCSPWSRPMMFGSAESEHPRLTNGEIISEEFQPMWSQSSESTNVTDRRTDDMRSQDRALH